MTDQPPVAPDKTKTEFSLLQLLPNMLTIAAICAGISAIRFAAEGNIALAVALYLFFRQTGLSSTITGYVLAHSVIAMPFAVFTIAAALSSVDATLEDAAMSCGASRFAAFRLVTLPIILPNVLSGGLFAFILSFDEPVISFFLAGIRDKTLPRMMFDDIEQNLTPIIPAIAVLLTGISIFVLVAAALLLFTGPRRNRRRR